MFPWPVSGARSVTALILLGAALFVGRATAAEVTVPFGSEFTLTSTTADVASPSIAMRPDGRFSVVWRGSREPLGTNDEYTWGIYRRDFSAVGIATGVATRIYESPGVVPIAPNVAIASDGSSLVCWRERVDTMDSELSDVLARAFAPDGEARGTEFTISPQTGQATTGATVTAVADDSFVIVWSTRSPRAPEGPGNLKVVAHRVSLDGEPQGSQFQVSTDDAVSAIDASVARLSTAGFVVAWSSRTTEPIYFMDGVDAQMFDGAGDKVGDELTVAPRARGKARRVAVTGGTDGFVVAWTAGDYDDELPGSGVRDVMVRAIATDGAPSTDATLVHDDGAGRQARAQVARLAHHGFVVAWQDGYSEDYYSTRPPGDGHLLGIFGRKLGASGVPTGTEFQVNTYTTHNQRFDPDTPASIVADAEGNFVVMWTNHLALVARRYCLFSDDSSACGDADCVGDVLTTTDALTVLGGAIGGRACPACICDTDSSGTVTATDALRVLGLAAGLGIELVCSECSD